MKAKFRFDLKVGAAVATALISGGCILAAAGAGAGGTIYFTGNGVESLVASPVENAMRATERAFEHHQITRTEYREEEAGARLELKGKTDDEEIDVTVTLERQGDESTRVEVTARTSPVTWDKDFAREVAETIVEYAGEG